MDTALSTTENIDVILQKNSKRLGEIEDLYKSSLSNRTISAELKLEIKEFVEGLRSCLDYIWKKIPGRPNNKQNFPISNSELHFKNATNGIASKFLEVLSKYQEFNNHQWLKSFSSICNDNKHVDLIPQKTKENKQVKVSNNSGGAVSWESGVRFDSGVRVMGVPIDSTTQMPVQNNLVKTEVTIWVDFQFENGISVLPFLKQSFNNVKDIVNLIEQELE